jgi:hypothetical protein
LAQQYGALLNLCLTIRHGEFGIRDHLVGAGLISSLTHELGMRVKEWLSGSNPRYHWLYRHEADTDGHLVTRLALSVAEDHLTAVLRWLRSKFFARRFDGEVFPAHKIPSASSGFIGPVFERSAEVSIRRCSRVPKWENVARWSSSCAFRTGGAAQAARSAVPKDAKHRSRSVHLLNGSRPPDACRFYPR